jgi:hypothetical protein
MRWITAWPEALKEAEAAARCPAAARLCGSHHLLPAFILRALAMWSVSSGVGGERRWRAESGVWAALWL